MNELSLAEPGTVRRNIQDFIIKNQGVLRGEILEIGSRRHVKCGLMNNRQFAPDSTWIGIDAQHGDGVDRVCDAHNMPFMGESFDTILCSDVLGHVKNPQKVISECYRVLRPNGAIIITTLFSFIIHGYPDDFWRFTDSCLAMMLKKAGFSDIRTKYDGFYKMSLEDHRRGESATFNVPMHVFATGKK